MVLIKKEMIKKIKKCLLEKNSRVPCWDDNTIALFTQVK